MARRQQVSKGWSGRLCCSRPLLLLYRMRVFVVISCDLLFVVAVLLLLALVGDEQANRRAALTAQVNG